PLRIRQITTTHTASLLSTPPSRQEIRETVPKGSRNPLSSRRAQNADLGFQLGRARSSGPQPPAVMCAATQVDNELCFVQCLLASVKISETHIRIGPDRCYPMPR
ncbi:hypothetical protein, partial [Streptomyces sp. NPDC101150]|uniref:hypothetical protein n=1 Tax=Streptomyces sp. NPDC101150 TaxID=3366114 RepID=UPI0037FC1B6C